MNATSGGHTVYFLEPHDIYIRQNQVVARMRNITVPPESFHEEILEGPHSVPQKGRIDF